MDSYESFLMVMNIYYSVIIFLFGICIGSFLNVLIYRIPIGMDFKKGSSICTTCKHELKWYDLFPLFSWLFLRGKCRYCGAKISAIYPIVESITGLLFVCSFVFGTGCHFRISLLGYFAICCALVVTFCIDWKHMFIPDSMWITILIGGIIIYIDSIIRNGWNKDELISRIIGALSVSVLFWLVDYLKPNSIGGGDIKLMFAAGFGLGWIEGGTLATGWVKVLLALVIAGFVGTVALILTNSLKKENMKKKIPFGPHLTVGIFASLMFGDLLINWYTGLFA